jgi:hypothetical protein
MNERIRELYYECQDESQSTEQCYQKFAELIVRECGVALSPMLRDMISRGQAFDLIKKHFGVEE